MNTNPDKVTLLNALSSLIVVVKPGLHPICLSITFRQKSPSSYRVILSRYFCFRVIFQRLYITAKRFSCRCGVMTWMLLYGSIPHEKIYINQYKHKSLSIWVWWQWKWKKNDLWVRVSWFFCVKERVSTCSARTPLRLRIGCSDARSRVQGSPHQLPFFLYLFIYIFIYIIFLCWLLCASYFLRRYCAQFHSASLFLVKSLCTSANFTACSAQCHRQCTRWKSAQ